MLKDVTKAFNIGHNKDLGALARFISLFSGKEPRRKIQIIKGISFNAGKGEVIGMVGKNGAGKSTLLRILAGIYHEDGGEIRINGHIIPIIGLGYGFLERLSMKDNVYLTAAFFGLDKKEIDSRFESIVKFAELEEFVNTKLFQFSVGMRHRLAFSIAIHCKPDILLLDEVFEVGDKDFRMKSSKKIKEIAKKGTTVILVSHELWMIEKHCERTIWIKDGLIELDGDTDHVLKKYKADSDYKPRKHVKGSKKQKRTSLDNKIF